MEDLDMTEVKKKTRGGNQPTGPSNIVTRHKQRKDRSEIAEVQKTWLDHADFGEVLQKETFYGVKKLLDL